MLPTLVIRVMLMQGGYTYYSVPLNLPASLPK
jgi:hypothetical protein